jgi:hypothetical protein
MFGSSPFLSNIESNLYMAFLPRLPFWTSKVTCDSDKCYSFSQNIHTHDWNEEWILSRRVEAIGMAGLEFLSFSSDPTEM